MLEDVAFRVSLPDAPLAAARAALLDEFAFEDGAPVREFDRELHAVLGGPKSPWSHDPRGTPESVGAVAAASLEAFRAANYHLAEATAAVIGAVDVSAAHAAVTVGAGPLRRPTNAEPAWGRGERVPIGREVTNAWIGAAYPAPRNDGLPRTRLEFAALQIEDALTPTPPDPGLFSVSVTVEDTPGGPVLLVQAAVMPEVIGVWEQRIRAAVSKLEDPADDTFFNWQRRRFRNQVLLREGQPEDAALRMALDLQRDGRVRPLQQEVWGIGPRDVAKAIADLGEPRVLLMGPDVAQGGDR